MANFNVGEQQPRGLASDGTNLYMIGSTNDALYTVDTATGNATRVGPSITSFGVGETEPTGLEFHNSKLYMVGEANERLYEIDKATGQATAVRPPLNTGFGASITQPRGITNHSGTLYMVNDGGHYLSSVDSNGIATRIGNATRYGVTDLEIRDLASDGTNLYGLGKVTTSGSETEGLYTLSTSNGTATFIGTTGVTSFGVSETSPEGLASDGTNLWMVGGNAVLYKLNTSTSGATVVGTSQPNFWASESDPKGIAYVGTAGSGHLWMVSSGILYELRLPASEGDDSGFTNPNSRVGSGRAIGNFSGVNLRNVSDIATDGTTIWVVNSGNAIYTIATNGRATAVTNTTHGLTNITGIAYSGTANTLYAVTSTSSANGTLYTINVNTSGAATRIGAVGGVGVNSTAGLVNSNGSSAPNPSNPLYMVGDAGSGSLYTLNTTTGAATRIGGSVVSNFNLSTRETDPVGIAYGGSTLYMIGQNPSGPSTYPPFYTIDTSTGVATKQGAGDSTTLNWQLSGLHFLMMERTIICIPLLLVPDLNIFIKLL